MYKAAPWSSRMAAALACRPPAPRRWIRSSRMADLPVYLGAAPETLTPLATIERLPSRRRNLVIMAGRVRIRKSRGNAENFVKKARFGRSRRGRQSKYTPANRGGIDISMDSLRPARLTEPNKGAKGERKSVHNQGEFDLKPVRASSVEIALRDRP